MVLFPVKKYFCTTVIFILLAVFVFGAVPVFAQGKGGPQLSGEKAGYAIGVSIGRNMKDLSINIDPDMITRGIRDVLKGQLALSDQDIKAALDEYEKEVVKKLGDKNRKEGDAFLKENSQRKSVVTLPSGLQYMVLRQGSGVIPKLNDMVKMHYRARLIDGAEFENTHWNNKPAEIVVGSTIKGWTEALTKMPVGSIWRLYIPSELAYGTAGAGQVIGPNAVIICDIELLATR